MSLFRFVKYSSILYFLGKHRDKLFRSLAVLLFALVTSLLYDDLRLYLEARHPETLIYALVAKVLIVYGSLVFVLLQFRPRGTREKRGEARAAAIAPDKRQPGDKQEEKDRLDALADVEIHGTLRTRYDRVLAGDAHASDDRRSSTKSSRS